METINVREYLDKESVSTARGRNLIKGQEINTQPTPSEIARNAMARHEIYLEFANSIRAEIGRSVTGISAAELEKAEFVVEYLLALSDEAHKTAKANY